MEGFDIPQLQFHSVDTQKLTPSWSKTRHPYSRHSVWMNKLERLFILGTLLVLLLLATRFTLRFFLLSVSLFVDGVYWMSDLLLYPFAGLLPDQPYYGFLIDGTTLVAISVYSVLALLILAFVRIVR